MSVESELDEAADRELEDAFEDEVLLDRGDTGLRLLFTLLFFVIVRLVEGLLLVLVLFQLGVALITQREPSDSLKRFANQVISYLVKVARYITFNESQAPFPFREFPEELDLSIPAQR